LIDDALLLVKSFSSLSSQCQTLNVFFIFAQFIYVFWRAFHITPTHVVANLTNGQQKLSVGVFEQALPIFWRRFTQKIQNWKVLLDVL
jgi:hypothetical protein